jgi:nucleoside-diphosphate-sugar epimerase
VRNATRLPSEYVSINGISIVEGSLSDPKSLDEALKGVTIVVSFLGAYPSLQAFFTRDTSTPIADSFEGVIEAMKRNNVNRIMALSTPAYRVEGETVRFFLVH